MARATQAHFEALPTSTAKAPLRAQHLATDWVWRPTFWQTPVAYSALSGAGNGAALNDEIKMFHNADHAQITSRQIIQIDPINLPDFGLSLDVYDFSSGYISLAIRLPAPFAKNLQKASSVAYGLCAQGTKIPIYLCPFEH